MKSIILKGLFLIAFATNGLYAQKTYYVNKSVTKSGNGTSWKTAKKDLQEALDLVANKNDQIWVAKGTYYPTKDPSSKDNKTNDKRNKTFYIKEGVKIYGGFSGYEKTVSERNIEKNPTVLSGDIGKKNDDTDNAYHVVLVLLKDKSKVVLDGLTITKGRATGGKTDTATIDKTTVHQSNGGAIYNRSEGSVLELKNCIIKDNKSAKWGGALFTRSLAHVVNCKFIENEVTGKGFGVAQGGAICGSTTPLKVVNSYFLNNKSYASGGAIFYYNTEENKDDMIVNSVFINNTAKQGGAIFFYYSYAKTKVVNCSFFGKTLNTSDKGHSGDAIYTYYSNPNIKNSIIWSDNKRKQLDILGLGYGERFEPVLMNSIYYDGNADGKIDLPKSVDKGGNINKDPNYVSVKNMNLALQEGSPAIDKGKNTNYENYFVTKDIAGNKRIIGKAIDMGAYEYSGKLSVDAFALKSNAKVYPVPFTNSLTISLKNEKLAKYKVFNLIGKKVLEGKIEKSTDRINTSELKSGVFLLKITTSKQSEVTKIFKR